MAMETSGNPQLAVSAEISGVEHASKHLFENVNWFDTAGEKSYFDSTDTLIQRGDMLAFNRGEFEHYGLYLGKGAVVHVSKDKNDQGWVLVQALEQVRNNSEVTIKNQDQLAKDKYNKEPRPFREIFDALPVVGEKINYNLLFSNCKNYCTLWRYGVSFSTQAENGVDCTAQLVEALASSSSKLM